MNDKKEFEVVYSSELNDQELRKIVEDVCYILLRSMAIVI